MDNRSQTWGSLSDGPAHAPMVPAPVQPRPSLSLVTSRLVLAQPPEPLPADWGDAMEKVLAWLKVDATFEPPGPSNSFSRMKAWASASSAAPLFAPWHSWSPTAFQHGGLPALPKAQWAASYLFDHGVGGGLAQRGGDIMLMSPLPAVCAVDEAGGVPLPAAGVLKAMIGAARAQGRARLAVIVHARQRNAIARQLMMIQRDLTRDGAPLELHTIEEALRPLAETAKGWDAIIAMPDLRGIVFTLLARASNARGPWPMAWYGGGHGGQALLSITGEAAGEGLSRAPLDAPALIQSLALALHNAGQSRTAWRLHDAWTRLRDSGVTTPGRGSVAPYVKTVCDGDFAAMLTKGFGSSKRPVRAWRAIGGAEHAAATNRPAALHLVGANSSVSFRQKR